MADSRNRLESQQGNALIFVVTIGLVITMTFAAFMGGTVLVEERAVETELAKSRAYWAEMGNFNYAESRISFSQLCNGCGKAKDSALAPVLQAYFNELSNNKVWTYPDESPNYSITTTDVAATAGGQTFSGWLTATSAYTPSTLVASSSGKLPQMAMQLCVGLPFAWSHCGGIGNNNGGNTTAYFSVARLYNLPQP